jgi:SAM-dependent methyltransferase
MPIDDLIVCAVCHVRPSQEQLSSDGEFLCGGCGHTFRRKDGVFDMIPSPLPDEDIQKAWDMWQQLQDNGSVAYDVDPVANLSVAKKGDAKGFGEFSHLKGVALDIGCGPQAAPSYGMDFGGRLVGIDPLAGANPRQFDFVQGVGEYLPFPDQTFDSVLFATSLDHVLVPSKVLNETRRVLKPSGTVNIWFGHHHEDGAAPGQDWKRRARLALAMVREGNARELAKIAMGKLGVSRGEQAPGYMQTMSVPTGAADHFHAYHLDLGTVREWLAEAGMTCADVVERDTGAYFLRATVGSG